MTSPTNTESRSRTWLVLGLIAALWLGFEAMLFFTDEQSGNIGKTFPPDKPHIRIDPEVIDTTRNVVDVQVTFVPGNKLTGVDHRLLEDATIEIDPTAQPSVLRFAAGSVPSTATISFTADGDPKNWPFDTYTVPFEVYLTTTSTHLAESLPVDVIGLPSGFERDKSVDDQLRFFRPASTVVSAVVLCAMLTAIAAMAVVVAVQTVRGRRPFYPPMMTWFAAMVFAVAPLRNLLPGEPPVGAWVDRLVVVWVLAALVVSMCVYTRCWWKAN